MPKIKFGKTELGPAIGLPNIGETAANFNIMKFDHTLEIDPYHFKKLVKQQGQTIVVNVLPNYISKDTEENTELEETITYSMQILNEVFSGYKSISLLHIMAPGGALAKKYILGGYDNFCTLLNPEEFARDYGLQIKTADANENEILLARAIVVINPAGKFVYHELVTDLMNAPNYKACYDAAAQGIVPRQQYLVFWRDEKYNNELQAENKPKHNAEAIQLVAAKHTRIRSLVYDEILAKTREYSEMLEKDKNSNASNSNSETKISAETKISSENTVQSFPNVTTLTKLFSILGKTQDTGGKIEDRFQKLADDLADWLNGAPFISEVVTNPEDLIQFSNTLIMLLAKNLYACSLNGPTIAKEEFCKILINSIQECLDGFMKLSNETEEGLKYLSEILNNTTHRQTIFDELLNNLTLVLQKDGFILDICQNPSILGLGLKLKLDVAGAGGIKPEPKPASEPNSTKSNYSVASEIADSLTELMFTIRGTLRPKVTEDRSDHEQNEHSSHHELSVKCAL